MKCRNPDNSICSMYMVKGKKGTMIRQISTTYTHANDINVANSVLHAKALKCIGKILSTASYLSKYYFSALLHAKEVPRYIGRYLVIPFGLPKLSDTYLDVHT